MTVHGGVGIPSDRRASAVMQPPKPGGVLMLSGGRGRDGTVHHRPDVSHTRTQQQPRSSREGSQSTVRPAGCRRSRYEAPCSRGSFFFTVYYYWKCGWVMTTRKNMSEMYYLVFVK